MMLSTILLGMGLSMDCVAVILSLHAIDRRKKSLIHYFLPLLFATFHTVMPVIGWALGSGLKQFLSNYDHWVAFLLLFIVGGKMIHSAITSTPDKKEHPPTDLPELLLLALATSLDSVVVGMTFAFLNQPILSTSLIIGITTLTLSLSADIIGDHTGKLFDSKKQGIVGGLVIVAIGIKILLEHLLT